MARNKDYGPTKRAEAGMREKRAWELRGQGWSHQRIADELNVDTSTITKALKRAEIKHHDEFMADINEYKKRQTAVIERAAYSALEQYYKSQQKKMIVSQTGKTGKDGKFSPGATKTVQAIDQYGDAKLLGMFYKGLEDIRKIWGIGNEVISKEGVKSIDNMSVDEKVALFCSIPIEDRLRLLDSMITQKPVFDEEKQEIEPVIVEGDY